MLKNLKSAGENLKRPKCSTFECKQNETGNLGL